MTKVCSRCKEERPVSDFNKDRTRKDGLSNICRDCDKERKRKYREENQEKIQERSRKYRENNREKALEYDRKYREKNREKVREYDRKYREKNREKVREQSRKFYKENREKVRERSRKLYKENRDHCASKRIEYREKKNRVSAAMATKSGRWSQEELDLLVELRKTRTVYQCAIELGRTYRSTQRKIDSLHKKGVEI